MSSLVAQAIANYRNPSCQSVRDLEEDFNAARRVRRVLNKWRRRKSIRSPRLLVNDIILVRNVFEHPFSLRLLYEVCGPDNRTELNTVLVFMRLSLDFVDVDNDLYTRIREVVK